MDSVAKARSVSVIIRAFNEEQHLGRLLTGILRQSLREVEIILVDSGSTDATVAIASRYPVRILSVDPETFSFGRSLNVGCAQATGEFLVLASAHVYPLRTDWIERLIAPFSDPEVALSYGKQRGCARTKFSEHQVFRHWFPDDSHVSRSEVFCNNANAAIRRELWELHPYDESLTGLEDLAWANSVVHDHHKIAYVPAAEVIHVHDEAIRQVHGRYRREAIALKRIFPQERLSFLEFIGLLLWNIASDSYQAWRSKVFWTRALEILCFRLAQFWGTYCGFRQREPVTTRLRQKFYYPQRLGYRPAPAEHEEDSGLICYAKASADE